MHRDDAAVVVVSTSASAAAVSKARRRRHRQLWGAAGGGLVRFLRPIWLQLLLLLLLVVHSHHHYLHHSSSTMVTVTTVAAMGVMAIGTIRTTTLTTARTRTATTTRCSSTTLLLLAASGGTRTTALAMALRSGAAAAGGGGGGGAQLQQPRRRLTSSTTTTGGASTNRPRNWASSRVILSAMTAAAAASFHSSSSCTNLSENSVVECAGSSSSTPEDDDDDDDSNNNDDDVVWRIPSHCLEYDHYNGVTVHVQEGWMKPHDMENDQVLERILRHQLHIWRTENKKGVWLHVPLQYASVVPIACRCGFEFHQVVHDNNNHQQQKKNVLVLSQWLPTDSSSRLPMGPSHQVGVGCLVWHPCDDASLGSERRMLVVQEQTGPAAAWQLWKMPTGLLDDSEDVHRAAVRELREETGLEAHWDGMLAVRQAHSTSSPTASQSAQPAVGRKHSDLFFVCQMSLVRPNQYQTNCEDGDIEATTPTTATTTLLNEDNNHRSYWDNDPWTICPTEIAAIRWMTVREYAAQARWQQSPVYLELNQAILDAAGCEDDDNTTPTAAAAATTTALWKSYILPLRLDGGDGATNALYKSSNINKIINNNNDNDDDVDS